MYYFDNSATTRYLPKRALRAINRELKNSSNGGRSGHNDAVKTAVKISSVRTFFCKYLGANEIIFTKNCTEALNIVIFGAINKGAHVITTVTEHNSVLRPLYKLEKDKQISLSVVNADNTNHINPLHVERLIRTDTAAVIVNATSNVTGASANIRAIGDICLRYGICLIVDAAQALPHEDINMKRDNISFLACAGHKGLHGPQGTGFLAINSEIPLRPLLYGGTGTNSDSVYQPRTLPESLEAGTLNSAGIIGLGAAAKWTVKNRKKINDKIEKINSIILYGLKNMKNVEVYTPDGATSGVVSFNINGFDSAEVGDILNQKYKFAVRTGLHCAPLMHNFLGTLERGAVRISAGYNNTPRQARYLVKAVKRISGN